MANIEELEAFKNKADKLLCNEYERGNKHMKYETFRDKMIFTYGIVIIKVARAAKFHCGKDFMQDNGFTLDDEGDLIITPLEENGPSTSEAAASVAAQSNIATGTRLINDYLPQKKKFVGAACAFGVQGNRYANASKAAASVAAQSNDGNGSRLINDYLPQKKKFVGAASRVQSNGNRDANASKSESVAANVANAFMYNKK